MPANVLFDLDGTLIDSKPGIVAGVRHALRHLGHEVPPDADLSWCIGPPLAEVMTRLLAPFGDSRVQDAVIAYRDFYGRTGLFDARPYPGIPELLDRLHRGRTLFVATTKRTEFARTVLEHLGLAAHFRDIQGSESHGGFDDKAHLVEHLITRHTLDRDATILVGDREHDIFAARANGIREVAVLYGYGSREELQRAGATVLCETLADLAELLAHSRPAGMS